MSKDTKFSEESLEQEIGNKGTDIINAIRTMYISKSVSQIVTNPSPDTDHINYINACGREAVDSVRRLMVALKYPDLVRINIPYVSDSKGTYCSKVMNSSDKAIVMTHNIPYNKSCVVIATIRVKDEEYQEDIFAYPPTVKVGEACGGKFTVDKDLDDNMRSYGYSEDIIEKVHACTTIAMMKFNEV